jgi:hypothetical protein
MINSRYQVLRSMGIICMVSGIALLKVNRAKTFKDEVEKSPNLNTLLGVACILTGAILFGLAWASR